MRLKRAKIYKRNLAIYQTTYGFREPYQVIVDGEVCQVALQFRIMLKEQVPNILMGETKLMTTGCVMTELKGRGVDYITAGLVAKNFEKRRCKHDKNPVSGAECIKEIIGTDNPHNYCVATQSVELRKELRKVPGTPLIFISKSVLLLEPASAATLEKAKQIELDKISAPVKELERLKKVSRKLEPPAKPATDAVPKKKKKKGPSMPNPLSCKKKKASSVPEAPSTTKRKRENETTEKIITTESLEPLKNHENASLDMEHNEEAKNAPKVKRPRKNKHKSQKLKLKTAGAEPVVEDDDRI